MNECFKEEGDSDEQSLHRSRILGVLKGKEKVLAGSHRFHHVAVGNVDNSHRR